MIEPLADIQLRNIKTNLDEEYPFGDFHKLIQLIDFKGKKAVRFGYYVKDHGAP